MFRKQFLRMLVGSAALGPGAWAADTTYHVSSLDGNDQDDGLTPATAFATVGRVNRLALGPGDRVLFACGGTWRAEMLVITDSGSAAKPIVFGSNPSGCAQKPVLSGSLPIDGWTRHSGDVWVAQLDGTRFPHGMNQLFRNGVRQRLGRWPNADAPDGGYSTIDAHSPGSARITDNELPSGSWAGATIHMKGIRWYILNRDVTGSGAKTLDLNEDVYCYTGNCAGWGYFLNGHLRALDREGEWHHDAATNRVYLVSAGGAPGAGQVEVSAVLEGEGTHLGGIVLGRHLYEHISNVVIENFTIRNWFDAGITTPQNHESDDDSNVTIRDCLIQDVDGTGIRLATWIWNAGAQSGWRGGEGLQILNNRIERPNHYGIDSYAVASRIEGNTILEVGMAANFGRSGMGCGVTGSNCTENGAGIRVKGDRDLGNSGRDNVIQGNRLERIGMNGVDVFGPRNVLRNNFIRQACFTKGDCGAIRLFGGDSFGSTQVKGVDILGNVIVDTIGNTDGTHPNFRALFGFGIYVDHQSDDIEVADNTVINSTAAGVLFQDSRGTLTGNTLYGNTGSAQLTLVGAATRVASESNVFFGLSETPSSMRVPARSGFTASDRNAFFQPYRPASLWVASPGRNMTLEDWRAHSGMDGSSTKAWFSLAAGQPPTSEVFYNATGQSVAVPLGAQLYLDLEQRPVSGQLVLPAFASRVLVRNGQAPGTVPAGTWPPGLAFLGWGPLALLAAARIARLRAAGRRPRLEGRTSARTPRPPGAPG